MNSKCAKRLQRSTSCANSSEIARNYNNYSNNSYLYSSRHYLNCKDCSKSCYKHRSERNLISLSKNVELNHKNSKRSNYIPDDLLTKKLNKYCLRNSFKCW